MKFAKNPFDRIKLTLKPRNQNQKFLRKHQTLTRNAKKKIKGNLPIKSGVRRVKLDGLGV